MGQMCSDIGNIKIRLWTFQRFERLFAIMIFNFGSNDLDEMKIDIISLVYKRFDIANIRILVRGDEIFAPSL